MQFTLYIAKIGVQLFVRIDNYFKAVARNLKLLGSLTSLLFFAKKSNPEADVDAAKSKLRSSNNLSAYGFDVQDFVENVQPDNPNRDDKKQSSILKEISDVINDKNVPEWNILERLDGESDDAYKVRLTKKRLRFVVKSMIDSDQRALDRIIWALSEKRNFIFSIVPRIIGFKASGAIAKKLFSVLVSEEVIDSVYDRFTDYFLSVAPKLDESAKKLVESKFIHGPSLSNPYEKSSPREVTKEELQYQHQDDFVDCAVDYLFHVMDLFEEGFPIIGDLLCFENLTTNARSVFKANNGKAAEALNNLIVGFKNNIFDKLVLLATSISSLEPMPGESGKSKIYGDWLSILISFIDSIPFLPKLISIPNNVVLNKKSGAITLANIFLSRMKNPGDIDQVATNIIQGRGLMPNGVVDKCLDLGKPGYLSIYARAILMTFEKYQKLNEVFIKVFRKIISKAERNKDETVTLESTNITASQAKDSPSIESVQSNNAGPTDSLHDQSSKLKSSADAAANDPEFLQPKVTSVKKVVGIEIEHKEHNVVTNLEAKPHGKDNVSISSAPPAMNMNTGDNVSISSTSDSDISTSYKTGSEYSVAKGQESVEISKQKTTLPPTSGIQWSEDKQADQVTTKKEITAVGDQIKNRSTGTFQESYREANKSTNEVKSKDSVSDISSVVDTYDNNVVDSKNVFRECRKTFVENEAKVGEVGSVIREMLDICKTLSLKLYDTNYSFFGFKTSAPLVKNFNKCSVPKSFKKHNMGIRTHDLKAECKKIDESLGDLMRYVQSASLADCDQIGDKFSYVCSVLSNTKKLLNSLISDFDTLMFAEDNKRDKGGGGLSGKRKISRSLTKMFPTTKKGGTEGVRSYLTDLSNKIEYLDLLTRSIHEKSVNKDVETRIIGDAKANALNLNDVTKSKIAQ